MDAGRKRCLPMWMSERRAHEELRESGNGESRFPFQGHTSKEASSQKTKVTDLEDKEEYPRQEANELDENPVSLLRPESRKESRRSSRLDGKRRTTSCKKSGLGRKKASEKNAAHNQSAMRALSDCEKLKQTINHSWPMNDVKLESLFPIRSEDDVGLTVEDLVSIAEERPQKANEECKSEAQDLGSSVLSENAFGGLCGVAQSSPQISKCNTIALTHSSATDMVESAPCSISRTGDVTQDMLDVFLGPLLRIPNEGNFKELRKKT